MSCDGKTHFSKRTKKALVDGSRTKCVGRQYEKVSYFLKNNNNCEQCPLETE